MGIVRQLCLVAFLAISGTVADCPPGYQLHNAMCYKVYTTKLLESDATATCNSDNGHLVSIQNAFDNSFFTSLANSNGINAFWIGLECYQSSKTSCVWDDGLQFNYNNFAPNNPSSQNGQCVIISTAGMQTGYWQSYYCGNQLAFICEVTPVVVPTTMSPPACASPQLLSTNQTQNGTVYSPGFPTRYEPNSCVYIITSPPGTFVEVQFPVLVLDVNSRIDFYNDIGDATPFRTINYTSTIDANEIIRSTENQMKVVFTALYDTEEWTNYRWEMIYETGYNIVTTPFTIIKGGCNQGTIYAPDTITSPNYPKKYPNDANCQYQLQSRQARSFPLHSTPLVWTSLILSPSTTDQMQPIQF